MGEPTTHLEKEIYDKRHELGGHIHELQDKAKNAVDWRAWTRERPWTMTGIAFAMGVLAAFVTRRRTPPARARYRPYEPGPESSDIWNVIGKLVGTWLAAGTKRWANGQR